MSASRRITTALLLSVAAHALLLATIPSQPPPRRESIQAGQLAVSLQPSEPAPEAPAQKRPAPPKEPERTTGKESAAPVETARTRGAEPVDAADSTVQPVVKKSHESAATTPKPRQHAKENADRATAAERHAEVSEEKSAAPQHMKQAAPGAEAAVRARLEDELARHFRYPMLARRRGWEGRVLLRLQIDDRGMIDSVQVVESSGHGVLDRAALQALAKVSRLPQAAQRLNGAGLQLELPVIYRLREG